MMYRLVQMAARIVLKLVMSGSICGFVLFVAMQDVVTRQNINTRLSISIQQNTQLFSRLNLLRIGDGVMWIIHSSKINLKLQISYYTDQAFNSRSPCSPLKLSKLFGLAKLLKKVFQFSIIKMYYIQPNQCSAICKFHSLAPTHQFKSIDLLLLVETERHVVA